MSLIQRFLLGNRVDDDLQVGLFLKNDGTVWLRNPDGSETQVSGGGGGGFPPAGWTVGVRGDFLLQPTGDGDADIHSLILQAPTDSDEWHPFQITDGDGNVLAEITADGTGSFGTLGGGGGPSGSVIATYQDDTDGSILTVQGIFDLEGLATNVSDYMLIARSGGVDAWGLKPGGQEYAAVGNGAPDDSVIGTSQRVQWYDDTTGAPKQRIKEKDAAGTQFNRISAVLIEDATAFAGITKPSIPTAATGAQIAAALNTLGLVTLT